MDGSYPRWLLALVVLVVLGLVGGAAAVQIFGTSSGWVQHNATHGPEILTKDIDYNSSVPITEKQIDFGHTVFYGNGSANATNFDGNLELSDVQANATLWTDRTGLQPVGVSGIDGITLINTDPTLDTTDLSVSGSGTVYVDGFSPGEGIRVNRTNSGATTLSANSSGVVSFSVSDDDVTLLEADEPTLLNADPDGAAVTSSPVDLSIDVEHDDFEAGESITLNWTLNGQPLTNSTVTQAQTVTVQAQSIRRGTNTWSVTAEDTTGDNLTTTGSFSAPEQLEFRKELKPNERVNTTADIEVTFFGDNRTVVERTSSNGTVDMSGLPLDEEYTIQVNASGYYERQSFARSILDQQTHFLLNNSADVVETQFVLDDQTGDFSSRSTRVFVQKALTINGTTEWRNVVGDRLGTGGFTTLLHQDQRYLIVVEDAESGARRELGPYVATTSDVVELEIDQIDYEFAGEVQQKPNYEWTATYENKTQPIINFAFQWDNQTVDEINVRIRQRGGNETVIFQDTYRNVNGPIQERILIPPEVPHPDTQTYLVEWNATNSPEVAGSAVIGKTQLPLDVPGVGDGILSIVGVFLVLIVAGLFSSANISVGAIVTALVAGGLWFIGVLPSAVSGIFVLVALLLGVLIHIRRGPEYRG